MATTQVDWPTQIQRKPFFDARDYGAKGNGTTDDTAALQAAITAAAGGTLFIPAGTYKVTSSITVPSNSVIVGVPGRTILNGTKASGTINVFSIIGTVAASKAITANINTDPTSTLSPTVTVDSDDSASFAAGDYVLIIGEQTNYTDMATEVTVVNTSSAGTITTLDPVLIRVNTADATHSIAKLTPVSGVHIAGITFDGTGASSADTSRGIQMTAVVNSSIKQCKFQNFTSSVSGGAGLGLYIGYNVTLDDIELYNSGNANESDLHCALVSFSNHKNIRSFKCNGFGPQWQYSVGLTVNGVLSSSTSARGTKFAGIGRSSFSDFHVTNPGRVSPSLGDGMTFSWKCWNMLVNNVHLEGCPNNYGSIAIGASSDVTISNVSIVGSSPLSVQVGTDCKNISIVNLASPDPVDDLGCDGFSVTYDRPYRIKAYSTADPAVTPASGVETPIPFDTESFDIGGFHSTTVNNDTFTIPVTGVYRLMAHVLVEGAAVGPQWDLRWVHTAGPTTLGFNQVTPSAGWQTVSLNGLFRMVAGDTYKLIFLQTTGSGMAVAGGYEYKTSISLELVR